jgi:predicted ArsR family transcriptional regulator
VLVKIICDGDFGDMSKWTFITNHGLVLSYISRNPRTTTARDIATAVGITERAVHRIIADLAADGYISRRRKGRQNIYRINPELRLRHESHEGILVGDLLEALGWKRSAKQKKLEDT